MCGYTQDSRIYDARGRVDERQGHHRQLGDRRVRVMNTHNRRSGAATARAEVCQPICPAPSAAAPPALQPRSRVALVPSRTHDRSLEHAGIASRHLEHFYGAGAHRAR